MSRHQFVALTCLAFALTAFAAAPPPAALAASELAALVEQLGDADFRARERAEKRLRSEGARALPLLRKALGHKELEVRRRAMRLVPALEQAVLFAPKRVSFRAHEMPMGTVLEQLSKASGYKVSDGNGMMMFPGRLMRPDAIKEKRFTYDFVNEPFWDVVERLCRDDSLTVQSYWGDEGVRLSRGPGHAPHACRSGPFRAVANGLQLYRNVDLSTAANSARRSETLTLNFTVFAEPRLPFLAIGEVRLESAYDDRKNSMVPRREPVAEAEFGLGFRGRSRYYGGNYKQMSLQGSVQLERRGERATSLRSVKGVAPMTVLVDQKAVVISDKVLAAKGVTKEVGDLTFEMKEVKTQGTQVSVQMTISNKKSNDFSWQNSLYNRIELFDNKGMKYSSWGSSWSGGGGNQVQLTLTYNSNGPKTEPAKLTFMHWETRVYDVEFEFRDVPLP